MVNPHVEKTRRHGWQSLRGTIGCPPKVRGCRPVELWLMESWLYSNGKPWWPINPWFIIIGGYPKQTCTWLLKWYFPHWPRMKSDLVGGDWNMTFIFPYIWKFHHPNWRTHIFQRIWNHQSVLVDEWLVSVSIGWWWWMTIGWWLWAWPFSSGEWRER